MLKHAVLLQLLAQLTARAEPLEVLDTHAGAGLYDLTDEMARKSGEADAGVRRLISDPARPVVFDPLVSAVRALNPGGAASRYPGSPMLIAGALRPGDRYLGCELRPDDHASLQAALRAQTVAVGPFLSALQADGFAQASALPADPAGNTLILIDPPFERGDDYAQIARALAAAKRTRPDLVAAVWAPIKDLETLDALVRSLEGLGFEQGFVAEARLRPLLDPMRLNGCAMIVLGDAALASGPVAEAALDICRWVVGAAGEPGGRAQVQPLFL